MIAMSCQRALYSAAVMETKLALCMEMLKCSRRCNNIMQVRAEGEKHFMQMKFCNVRFPSDPTAIPGFFAGWMPSVTAVMGRTDCSSSCSPKHKESHGFRDK